MLSSNEPFMASSLGVITLNEGADTSVVSDSDSDNTEFAVVNVEIIPVERVDSVTGVTTYIYIYIYIYIYM